MTSHNWIRRNNETFQQGVAIKLSYEYFPKWKDIFLLLTKPTYSTKN